MNFLNVIIDNGNILPEDEDLIFGSDNGIKEPVVFVPITTTIFDLLIMIGSFNSKNQAKKNWKHGDIIPNGFSEFWIGKVKRHLTIWNPTE